MSTRILQLVDLPIVTDLSERPIYQSIRRHVPEDFYLHQSRENVEFRSIKKCWNSFYGYFYKPKKLYRLSLDRIASGVEAPSCLSFSSACSCCTYLFDAGPVSDILWGSIISERVVTKRVMVSILRKGIDSLQSRTVRQVHFMVPKDRNATRNTITKLQLQ